MTIVLNFLSSRNLATLICRHMISFYSYFILIITVMSGNSLIVRLLVLCVDE